MSADDQKVSEGRLLIDRRPTCSLQQTKNKVYTVKTGWDHYQRWTGVYSEVSSCLVLHRYRRWPITNMSHLVTYFSLKHQPLLTVTFGNLFVMFYFSHQSTTPPASHTHRTRASGDTIDTILSCLPPIGRGHAGTRSLTLAWTCRLLSCCCPPLVTVSLTFTTLKEELLVMFPKMLKFFSNDT